MSDGHTGPDDMEDEGQTVPEQASTPAPAAEKSAADAPVEPAEKPAPKKRAPRKPKPVSETPATEQTEMAMEKPAAAKPAARKPAPRAAEPPPPPPVMEQEDEPRGFFGVLREPVVMWSVIGGAIVIVAALGYVAWTQFGPKPAPGSASALASRSVCEVALDRVQAYGVIPPASTLTQSDADKTQTDKRVVCHAQAGSLQYAVTVDVSCDDMAKESCVKLYSVKQADGTALFQRQM